MDSDQDRTTFRRSLFPANVSLARRSSNFEARRTDLDRIVELEACLMRETWTSNSELDLNLSAESSYMRYT